MAPTQMGQGGAAPMLQEINALKRALESDPDNVVTLVRLANLYHDAGMFQQAIGFYETAAEADPRNPDVLTDLGTCYQAIGANDEALLRFARAQQADPTHWQSLFNTAVVLAFSLGRFDEAEGALQKVEAILGAQAPQVEKLRGAIVQARSRPR
jgi:tetratricopeptide (TPR) repeat protein